MVKGFAVDTDTPKPDCMACTEAKSYKEPYQKQNIVVMMSGQLTHMDLWRKYNVASINGHQYYILLINDSTHYITMHFLKRKDEAPRMVKKYIMYIKTQG